VAKGLRKKGKPFEGVKFSFRRLNGRIVEVYGSRKKFAIAMGMSPAVLSARLLGHTSFLPGEVWYASILLRIKKEEIGDFFFCTEEEEDTNDG